MRYKQGIYRLVTALLAAVVVVSCWLFGELIYYQAIWGSRLQAKFGFEIDTPYVGAREVLQLTHVEPDGVLFRNGFRSGDVLLDLDVRQFYGLLKNLRDVEPVTIKVASASPNEIQEQAIRVLSLRELDQND